MSRDLVTIDATDFDHAAAALSAAGFEDIAAPIVESTLRKSANQVRAEVRSRAARHGPKLAAGVHTTWKGAGLTFSLAVRSTGPVAHLIVGGVRPHAIHPGRPMRVPGALRGLAEVVQHPGFRGDPYVHRGIQAALPAIKTLVDAGGAQMVRELATRSEGT